MNANQIFVSALFCSVIVLWTMSSTHAYTSPYVNGQKPGKKASEKVISRLAVRGDTLKIHLIM